MDIQRKKTRKQEETKKREKNMRLFPHTSRAEVKLNWEAEEFSYYEKSRIWFLVGGAIFILIIAYFTIVRQLITAITFLLLGITVYIFSLKKPRKINCTITYQGIKVDTVTYSFAELSSFWIFYEPPDFKVISLKHKKPYLPLIQIPIGEADPMKVRETLLPLLLEEEQ